MVQLTKKENYCKTKKKGMVIEMYLLVGMFVFSVMGSSYFGISLGVFTLSPYRFLFLIMVIYTVLRFHPLKVQRAASIMLRFYFLWALWGACSILWAKDQQKALTSDIILFIALCSMVICSQILVNTERIQVVITAISVCFIFVTFVGLYESLTGVYYFVNKPTILARMAIDKYRAPLVFFTNQNDYSLFLVYGIFVVLYMRSITKIRLIRLIYDVTIVVAVWLIIFAHSRGGVLALAVGIIYWLFVNMRGEKRRTYVWFAFVVSSIIVILGALNINKIVAELTGYFHFGLETASIRSDANRFQLAKNGIDMLLSSFGVGVGMSNAGYYLEYVYNNTGRIWALHNWYIQIFAEAGLVIGTLYIVQYISLYRKLKEVYINTSDIIEKKQAHLFLTVIIAFIVGILSPSSVLDMEWLWMTWALIIAFVGQAYSNNDKLGVPSNE